MTHRSVGRFGGCCHLAVSCSSSGMPYHSRGMGRYKRSGDKLGEVGSGELLIGPRTVYRSLGLIRLIAFSNGDVVC